MKKVRIATLLLLIVLLLSMAVSAADKPVAVTIDGVPVVFTAESGSPFIGKNNRTLVPLRAVMETFGCEVSWDNPSRTAIVRQNGTEVRAVIGSSTLQVNGASVTIDTAPVIRDSRTYLPIRAVLEAFGARVDWDAADRTVVVRHRAGDLQVHFIDVGQADCILIVADGEAMLIDAGNNDDADTISSYLQGQGITTLRYAAATHPHEDHIGSMDTVLKNFDVQSLLLPEAVTETRTFENMLDAAAEKNIPTAVPVFGETYSLGNAVLTTVNCLKGGDLNNASLMFRMTYGDTSFLFVGDAEAPAEAAVLETGCELKSDVLKVGHHGSSSSTSAPFLRAVAPTYAVISCGVGNSYGHPHAETLAALAGVTLFRTDEQGTVIAESDGHTIRWSAAPAAEAQVTSSELILNVRSGVFHLPTCGGVKTMSEKNKQAMSQSRDELIAMGYTPCGTCNP